VDAPASTGHGKVSPTGVPSGRWCTPSGGAELCRGRFSGFSGWPRDDDKLNAAIRKYHYCLSVAVPWPFGPTILPPDAWAVGAGRREVSLEQPRSTIRLADEPESPDGDPSGRIAIEVDVRRVARRPWPGSCSAITRNRHYYIFALKGGNGPVADGLPLEDFFRVAKWRSRGGVPTTPRDHAWLVGKPGREDPRIRRRPPVLTAEGQTSGARCKAGSPQRTIPSRFQVQRSCRRRGRSHRKIGSQGEAELPGYAARTALHKLCVCSPPLFSTIHVQWFLDNIVVP